MNFSKLVFLIASVPGASNFLGSKPLAFLSKSFSCSMYFLVASANANWHSVLTLILATPKDIAFLICSSGMPVPPCNTNGIPSHFVLISSKRSKFNPFQFEG